MKKIHLEGGLIVELKSDEQRMLKCEPWNGMVYHSIPAEAFGETIETEEAEFRANIKRVISRSRYDSR